jgi:hypothetical protein
MLHEVKLFGQESETEKVLHEIHRILVDGGKYFLLDHLDAGEGEVVVKLPEKKISQLMEFEHKFQYYPATHQSISDNRLRISKRCLQDFLTKDWSFNSPMESGFSVCNWIPFSDIREDLKRVDGELLKGEAWFRKFLLIAIKS